MMEDNYIKKDGYKKRPLWQWILLYVVAAGAAYGLIYYFFFGKNNDYVYNQSQNQTNNQQNTGAISNDYFLNLSNNGLTSLSQSIFDQTNLQELDISNNSLTCAIPAEIRKLKNLIILNAIYNQMTGVPAEIGQLLNLQVLDLSYNQITGLPNELGNLKNLKTLNLSGNAYSQQDLNGIRSKLPTTVNIIISQ